MYQNVVIPPRLRHFIPCLLAITIFGLVVVLLLPRQAAALPGEIVVDTKLISKTEAGNPNDGKCDLREALKAAFDQKQSGLPSVQFNECAATAGPNIITFSGDAAGGVLTFPTQSAELPFIIKDIAIIGPVTIDGGSTASTIQHIFTLGPGGTLSLSHLTLQNARSGGSGGAIFDINQGTINLLGVSFQNNVANSDGGAIYTNGTLNVMTSTFAGNKALGVAQTPPQDNPATGFGGAIRVDGSGTLRVALSNFNGNSADKGGGAIFYSGATAEISDTVFSGNLVTDQIPAGSADFLKGGGAIINDANATMTIIRSAFNGNLSLSGHGGALYNNISATGVISNTSFNGNIAGDLSNERLGGAIYNQDMLTVAKSAFINNTTPKGSGGAVANDRTGDLFVSNSTFSANAAPLGNGGAIYNTNTQQGGPASTAVLRNVTLSANVAQNDGGAAIFNGSGHSISLGNTIVDDFGLPADNCSGTITSLGHNIDSGNSCAFSQAGDMHDTDPMLDIPGFNGGPLSSLLTQKLKPGSPAVDAGDNAICNAAPVNKEDQRSQSRPKDGDNNGAAVCDIGAYESDKLSPGFGSTPVQPGPVNIGSTMFGSPITNTFTIFETGNAPLVISSGTLSGSNAGDFSIMTTFPFTISDGGPAVSLILRCNPAGPNPGERIATLTLTTNDANHPQVDYTLTCDATSIPTPGVGAAPAAPGPVEFGEVILGQSAGAAITLQEIGDATLQLSNPMLAGTNAGDFAVQTPFPIIINDNGDPVSVWIECTPTAVGLRHATLTLNTNDPDTPTLTFNLVCQAVPVPPPYLSVPGQSVSATEVPALDGAYGVAVSPDGRHVYVSGFSSGGVSAFSRDAATGELTFINTVSNALLAGSRFLVVSPDGKQVYVAGETAGAFVVLNRDISTGAISFELAYTNNAVVTGLSGAYGVAVSPDGRFIYVSSRLEDSLVIFYRDADGFVGYEETITSAADLDGALGLAISPDGTYLYVPGYSSPNASTGSLAVYKRNATDGSLTHVVTRHEGDLISINPIRFLDGLGGAFRVVFSPDGAYAYVASLFDASITVFRINPTTGFPSYIGVYKDGVSGIDGLAGASGVAVNPAGSHLFAAGYSDKAIAVFERDAETGLLTPVELARRTPLTGSGGQPALDGVREVTVSPDGSAVYAASYLDDAVVMLHVGNPRATIESLSPASALADGPAFTLTIYGKNFLENSQVQWNGTDRPTTYISNTQLQAEIAAADIVAAAGQANVTVVNPGPGGGASNGAMFIITQPGQNPLPTITSLSPAGAAAGSPAFNLTIYGSNFIPGVAVMWNGTPRLATFVNSDQLTIGVEAADLAVPGTAVVTAVNPGPGGGTSNAVAFTVAGPGENPVPSLSQIRPYFTVAHGAASSSLTLVVTGSNFVPGAEGQWNGASRPTIFVSSTELRLTLLPFDTALGGTGGVSVTNPAPGGGHSNSLTFTIYPYAVYVPMTIR